MIHLKLPCLSALCAALAFACQPVLADAGGKAAGQSLQWMLLAQNESPQRSPDVPYVPTTREVVEQMLRMAKVGKSDLVYDLGCGDGRIVIAAAKEYGARGVGVDIDPQRIREARENAKSEGVNDKVTFKQGDLFTTDIAKATVVTLYLLPSVNLKLRPKLLSELKPGTRIVSHNYDMGDWKPEQTVTVGSHTVYLWTVPDKGQASGARNQ
jgi:SAM-dependent methyltransferase